MRWEDGYRIPLYERWLRCVEKTDWCWLWKGPTKTSSNGIKYGYVRTATGRDDLAHRLSWLFHYGEIRDNLWVLHKCDNGLCVRPGHLTLGTPMDNNLDRDAKGRGSTGAKHSAVMKQRAARGEMTYTAKVRAEDVRIIRERNAAGESQSALGREYGLSQQTIHAMVKGKTWKHVE